MAGNSLMQLRCNRSIGIMIRLMEGDEHSGVGLRWHLLSVHYVPVSCSKRFTKYRLNVDQLKGLMALMLGI